MIEADLARPDLLEAVLARVRGGGAAILTGPPGAGKTTLLRAVVKALQTEGWIPLYLDLMGAASCPERFVIAALEALRADTFGRRLAEATAIRRLAEAGRSQEAAAVQALFSLWASLDKAGGRPVVLLLDEATEIRSLAYFAGLRQVERPFATALFPRRRGTLLATSFPTMARRLWPSLPAIEMPALDGPTLAPVLAGAGIAADASALARASFGWPRHVRVLLDSMSEGEDLLEAWASEMAPGGRLELACRHTYESLLLRSRGYGMSKAVLAAVAEEEGLNLTALVARLGRTPGAIRDYLGWLLAVDALKMVKKRYYYVDGMVRFWVRLHGRGGFPGRDELLAAAREAIGEPSLAEVAAAVTAAVPVSEPKAEPAVPLVRRDPLMEID